MDLTPELLGNSYVILLITYAIAFAIQLYMMYLNWKQSKVNNQMKELIEEVRQIKVLLERKGLKKK
jgi:hypothetical protein